MDIISVVIPFLNEEDCILDFCEFINSLPNNKPYEIEVIFVDDGSTDNSVNIINNFDFSNCFSAKIVSLSRNFGSHAAIRAGIKQATGRYCTYVGADMQEPADMIDIMYNNIINSLDAVYIDKRNQQVDFFTRMFSQIYAALMRKYAIADYGKGGIGCIMINHKIINYLNNNVENNSSINLQIIDAGFKKTVIEMDYNGRKVGVSKWTFAKKIKLFVDSFVAFSFMPIRAVSMVGIGLSFLGFILGAKIIINKLIHPEESVMGYPTLAVLILIGFGITNISLGIIAEYLWRTYDAARNRPPFIISEIKEIKKD